MTRLPAKVPCVRSVRFAAALALVGLVLTTMLLGALPAAALPPVPVVTSLSVTSGSTIGGTSTTIVGSGFIGTSAVSFGGTLASYSVVDDSHITAIAPGHAAGTYHVIVTANAQNSTPVVGDQFTYYGYLSVTGLNPNLGPAYGGTPVTVFGSGFLGATQVTFGGLTAPNLVVYSDSQLTVISPPHFSGYVDVVVWIGGTPSPTTFNDRFLYGGGLTVTSVSPPSGPSTGDTTVTVTGTGFSTVTAVTFGSSPAVYASVYSDNFLTVTAPPHFPGPVDVRVWAGGNVSSISPADVFLYMGGAILTGVSPSTGPTSGGTRVILTGSGLAGTTAVTFGGAAATNIIVASDNQLVVTTPPHSVGTVDVVVWTTLYGLGTTGGGLFTYVVTGPTVTGLIPNSGTTAGGTQVTVAGSAFSNATSVSFGGAPGTGLSVNSDTQLTVNAPPHSAGTVDVTITTNGVTSATNANDRYTYIAAPPVNPPARFVGGVTVNGQQAAAGTTVEARIGGSSCGTGAVFLSSGQARYALDARSSDAASGCGSDGATVTFFVGGVQAPQTGVWHSYQLNVVDLNVGSAPAPTPRPTVAPLPPNAGGGNGTSVGDTRLALLMLGALAVLAAAALGIRIRAHALVAAPILVDEPAASILMAQSTPGLPPESRRRWVGLAAVGAALGLGLFLTRSRRE